MDAHVGLAGALLLAGAERLHQRVEVHVAQVRGLGALGEGLEVVAAGEQEGRAGDHVGLLRVDRGAVDGDRGDLRADRRGRVVGVGDVVGDAQREHRAVRVVAPLLLQRLHHVGALQLDVGVLAAERLDGKRLLVGDVAGLELGTDAARVHHADVGRDRRVLGHALAGRLRDIVVELGLLVARPVQVLVRVPDDLLALGAGLVQGVLDHRVDFGLRGVAGADRVGVEKLGVFHGQLLGGAVEAQVHVGKVGAVGAGLDQKRLLAGGLDRLVRVAEERHVDGVGELVGLDAALVHERDDHVGLAAIFKLLGELVRGRDRVVPGDALDGFRVDQVRHVVGDGAHEGDLRAVEVLDHVVLRVLHSLGVGGEEVEVRGLGDAV